MNFRFHKIAVRLALAIVILFLFCGAGWAAARPLQGRASWMQPESAWGHGGADRWNGHHHTEGHHPSAHEHLPQWFRDHQHLSPQEQERALRNQPGFDSLPPWRQQRLFQRLQQLDAMPPERRERTLQRMEAMEKLSPEQRRQVRRTMRQVVQMPEDRRQVMRKAFWQLTHQPPAQRQETLNSPQFRSQFSDRERQMLSTLMSVQPYSPHDPAAASEYEGKH